MPSFSTALLGVPIASGFLTGDGVVAADAASATRDNPPTISIRGICLTTHGNRLPRLRSGSTQCGFAQKWILSRPSRTGQDGRLDLGEFPKPGLPGVHVGVVGKPGLPKGPIAYRVALIKRQGCSDHPDSGPSTGEHRSGNTSGTKLAGTVVDPGKRPVVGATVWVAGYEGMSDVGVATTNESGRFTIPDMTPWQSDVNMTANGAEPTWSRSLVVRHRDFGSQQCPSMPVPRRSMWKGRGGA